MTAAVDYWDYLGWKDTLALAGHGNRQRAYARVRGDRDVFTPQMIVNGAAQALGSDRAQIERAIGQTRRSASDAVVAAQSSRGRRQADYQRAGRKRAAQKNPKSGCARCPRRCR